MHVSSVLSDGALVELSRSEVIALRNLLVCAPQLPLEARGPIQIFGRLLEDFQLVAAALGSA